MRFTDWLGAGTMAILIALPVTAFAGGPGQGGQREERLKEVDANGDGVVTRAESDAAAKKRFDEVDTNKDGKISRAEHEAHIEAKRRERQRDHFQEMDTNGDGVISRDEQLQRSGDRFERIDADGDGQITAEERAAHREKMKEMMKQRREGGAAGPSPQ